MATPRKRTGKFSVNVSELANPAALPLLEPLTHHPDWQIRHRVVQALGNLGASALPLLHRLQSDPNPTVAELAQQLCSP